MSNDIDTLATALDVTTDDLLKLRPDLAPRRPAVGFAPRLTDAELVTSAVMQALLGFTSEARWLRYARTHLRPLFPYLPKQPGYNKRLRNAAAMIIAVIRVLASDTSLWTDDVWVVDSTPIECGRSRETVKRSDLAGWAEYGYCASHSRYFWGLRLHLVATLGGLPIGFALTGAKADERETLIGILHADSTLVVQRPGQNLICDKTTSGPGSNPAWPMLGCACCVLRAKANPNAREVPCSAPCANPSSRSTELSKPNWTWNAMAVAPQLESSSASCNASSRSPPRSGTTTSPAHRSTAR